MMWCLWSLSEKQPGIGNIPPCPNRSDCVEVEKYVDQKWVKVQGWAGAEAAHEEIRAGMAAYQMKAPNG